MGPISLYELFGEYEPKPGRVQGHVQDPGSYGGPRIVTYDAELEDAPPETYRPYLLLDIRSPQEYGRGHIKAAEGHPAMMLNQGRISPAPYSLKNKKSDSDSCVLR